MSDSTSLPPNVFRANVGAVIVNKDGKVLAFERSDIRDSWQMPQGGLKENEEPLEAVFREVHEETNLNSTSLELIAEYPEWLAYEIPKDKRKVKQIHGQVQKWFLFRLIGSEADIDLEQSEAKEFSSWKWTSLRQLVKETAPFRREIYMKLSDRFAQYTA